MFISYYQRFSDPPSNHCHDSIQILAHIAIPESEEPDTERFKLPLTFSVFLFTPCIRHTIDVDRELKPGIEGSSRAFHRVPETQGFGRTK